MIRHLRRLIHIVGMQLIDRQRFDVVARSRFDETLATLLLDPGFFFIQVGAHDGVRFDDLYQKVTAVHARGIVIEPLPRYFARLRMNYEDYPGVIPLNVAVHPTEKRISLHHVKPEATASGMVPPWAGGIGSALATFHQRSGIPADAMTTTTVECMTLREIIERHGVMRVDLLQIDAEGFDVEVLKMIPFDLVRPRLIKFEQIALDDSARRDAEEILKSQQYELWNEGENVVAAQMNSQGHR
jgi:FkbM family methyltransferase